MNLALSVVFAAFVQPPAQLPAAADVSVSGISIADTASTQKVLGADVDWDAHGEPLAHAHFLSKDKRELLTLFVDEDGTPGAVTQFLVQKASRRVEAEVLPGVDRFTTGKAVALGMGEADVIAALGKPSLVEDAGYERTLRYEIADDKSPFLKRYKARAYFGVYTFQQGRLAQFVFGVAQGPGEREGSAPGREQPPARKRR